MGKHRHQALHGKWLGSGLCVLETLYFALLCIVFCIFSFKKYVTMTHNKIYLNKSKDILNVLNEFKINVYSTQRATV